MAKMGHVGHHNMPGIPHAPEICVHSRGSKMGWLCLKGYFFFPPSAISPFFLVLLGLCCFTSSHIDTVALHCTRSVHPCFVAVLGCCVCSWRLLHAVCARVHVCVMSEALSCVSLLKSCLWPSLFAWMERDCIALMLWTNSCAEFDAIFFISYCFPFSVLLCCI